MKEKDSKETMDQIQLVLDSLNKSRASIIESFTPILDKLKRLSEDISELPAVVEDGTIEDESKYPYFVDLFNEISEEIYTTSVKNGFWENERNNGEMIALMHSELSEALETLRHPTYMSEHIPMFTATEEELADCIIRIMDMAFGRNYRIAEAILAKLEFNKTRPYKHGKSF